MPRSPMPLLALLLQRFMDEQSQRTPGQGAADVKRVPLPVEDIGMLEPPAPPDLSIMDPNQYVLHEYVTAPSTQVPAPRAEKFDRPVTPSVSTSTEFRGELPFETYQRLTGKRWTGGQSPEIMSLLEELGITGPAGSAQANTALQRALLARSLPFDQPSEKLSAMLLDHGISIPENPIPPLPELIPSTAGGRGFSPVAPRRFVPPLPRKKFLGIF